MSENKLYGLQELVSEILPDYKPDSAHDDDPTPDQLLAWVSREIADWGYDKGDWPPRGRSNETPTDVAQRIIDTVKRVTG